MIFNHLPLLSSHLQFAHSLWKEHLKPGDWVIDATCGRGFDTLFLSNCLAGQGGVIAMDIQEEAILATQARVKEARCFLQSHETFPPLAYEHPIALVVYNLGYLPSGNKQLTTKTQSTLTSISHALQITGRISITCYPGHEEGKKEEEAILRWILSSDASWQADYYSKEDNAVAPSFIWMTASHS